MADLVRTASAGLSPQPVRDLLLGGRIDYAGLFPPAALAMAGAVRNYAAYRGSDDAWALGRFVVPAARLDECLAAIRDLGPAGRGWSLSVTLGADPVADLTAVRARGAEAAALGIELDCFEARVAGAHDVDRVAAAMGPGLWYGETPLGAARDEVLDALARAGARAKIRMGGVTPELFPASVAVAEFLVAATARALPFKATAGLHHPVRGRFRLTYEPGSPLGTMFGYLNLMVATALAARREPLDRIVAALDDDAPDAFRLTGGALVWDALRLDAAELAALRGGFDGFGSCSFREPLDELAPAVER